LLAILSAVRLAAALVAYFYIFAFRRYKFASIITIIIFGFINPTLSFLNDGFSGNTGVYSTLFAIIIIFLVFENKKALIFAVMKLIHFIGLTALDLFFPDSISFSDSAELLIPREFWFYQSVSILFSVTVISSLIFLFFRFKNRQELELEAARKEALRLSEVKHIFLSNMSHEIRTPINVMLGMTEMILRDSRDDSISDYAQKIQSAGKMLRVLIGNILDMTRIESGKIELVEDNYRTSALIQELFEIGSASAFGCGLDFKIELDEGLPAELWGDMPRIKQIVSNFLSNAAKYTNYGSITLEFSYKESENENQTILCVSVRDTGIGIKKEELPLLFEAFVRLDSHTNRNIDGSGLGLAIAKELAELMKGQVFVESEYGAGSLFWLEIPQKIIDKKPIEDWKTKDNSFDNTPKESFIAPDARILVVDDNIENLQTVKALLKRTLMHVDLAESGPKCLEAVRNTDYHVIIMDQMMPDMDGIETYRRLKEEHPDFNIPVIALSANAIFGAESKFLAEGFSAYITKPVQVPELEEALLAGLVLSSVAVNKITINPQTWVTPELKENLAHELAPGGVSLEEGLRNASGDLLLLARIAEVFIQNYPVSLAQMQKVSGAASSDFEELGHLAHSLKSVAGYVGATNLSFLARRVETGCKVSDSQVIRLAMPLLYLEWERANNGLSSFVEHVCDVEPMSSQETDSQYFQPERLIKYIKLKVRRKALQELELLIAQKGLDCPVSLLEAKRAIRELDFNKAERIMTRLSAQL
jgi:signal transduction histidine kinase/DNA-binding NarL/FixJ family response regulator/HPt (histidine-containing phosphotransfer) domain-containing protein